MHEMALVRDVVDLVVKEAEAAGATEVRTVSLTIGYVRDIVEDQINDCFAYLARGTVAEHAELVIVRVPLTVRCNECGYVYHIDTRDDKTWTCRSCSAKDYKINTGMEFSVDDVEIVGGFATDVQVPG
jgi:hydrogenase nickel incorporation protein HypA/HybF